MSDSKYSSNSSDLTLALAGGSSFAVKGVGLDAQTRCAHWHGRYDIVASCFPCCGEWFACYDCHLALSDHAARAWPKALHGMRAVRCGCCTAQMTISAYLVCDSRCPSCGHGFNPGCKEHAALYFQG